MAEPGNVLLSFQTLSDIAQSGGYGGGGGGIAKAHVRVSDIRGVHNLFVYNGGGAEATFSWSAPEECKLLRAWTVGNGAWLISRNSGLTLSNYLVTGVTADQFWVVAGTGTPQAGVIDIISWRIRIGETLFFRGASGGQLHVIYRNIPPWVLAEESS